MFFFLFSLVEVMIKLLFQTEFDDGTTQNLHVQIDGQKWHLLVLKIHKDSVALVAALRFDAFDY